MAAPWREPVGAESSADRGARAPWPPPPIPTAPRWGLAPKDGAERKQIVAAYKGFIDDHLKAFPSTPVVMLGLGSKKGEPVEIMAHAIKGGAGWRVDCWGDWGILGTAWNHQTSLYPDMIANLTAAVPSFPDVWKQAPVQLEVCSTMPDWHSRGWKATKPGELCRGLWLRSMTIRETT
jgi:hypothetical protein